MASIVVVSGPNKGDYYPLGKRTLVIGRGEQCAVQIVDDQISRRHLQIRFDDQAGQYIACDMSSANGTWINGRRCDAETSLTDNDAIEIGESKVLFTVEDFPDRESAWDHWKQRGERARSTLER